MRVLASEENTKREHDASDTVKKLRIPASVRMKAANASYQRGEGTQGTLQRLTLRPKKSTKNFFNELKDSLEPQLKKRDGEDKTVVGDLA